jgi:hypothetical protein
MGTGATRGGGTLSSSNLIRLSNPSWVLRGTTGSGIKTGATGGSTGASGVRREGLQKGDEEADSGEAAAIGETGTTGATGGGDRERLTGRPMGSVEQRGATGSSGSVVAHERDRDRLGDGESGANRCTNGGDGGGDDGTISGDTGPGGLPTMSMTGAVGADIWGGRATQTDE